MSEALDIIIRRQIIKSDKRNLHFIPRQIKLALRSSTSRHLFEKLPEQFINQLLAVFKQIETARD